MIRGQWVPCTEESRTYIFPNGHSVTFVNVIALRVSQSGTHYLETETGKHIVNDTWLAISIKGSWQL